MSDGVSAARVELLQAATAARAQLLAAAADPGVPAVVRMSCSNAMRSTNARMEQLLQQHPGHTHGTYQGAVLPPQPIEVARPPARYFVSAQRSVAGATPCGTALRPVASGRADTRQVTTATMKIERSGPAIRAALAQFAPSDCPVFEAELRQAIRHAADTLDLASAEAALDRWWGVAVIRANPLSEQEQAQVARAKAGDFAGLLARDEHGNWVQL